MTRRRRISLGLVGTAAAAAVTIPILAFSAPGDPPRLPDLVSDRPDGPRFDTYDPVGHSQKLLIRFNGYVHNDGDGPLDIQGNPQLPAGSPGGMDQYLWNGTGARDSDAQSNPSGWTKVTDHPNQPDVEFDVSDTHNHFHVKRLAEYSLWNDAKTALVMPGSKVGFCQYDSMKVADNKGPATAVYGNELTGNFCRQGQPGATQLREGISEGFRDIYDYTLDYQWIDVSNVMPGRYWLATRMDPENRIKETNEANNGYAFSYNSLVVPGYVAKAVGPFTTPYRSAGVQVTLNSDAFTGTLSDGYGATLGTLKYRLESLPAGGVIKNAAGVVLSVGSTFTANQVTYVPNRNFSGADSFTYSALNTGPGGSAYPLQPTIATASITVGASGVGTVSLSGAPTQMTVGTQVQLTASASNSGGIQWTTSAGTISPTGVLTAPATVPAGGTITVRATHADDSSVFKEVTITVVAAPVDEPRPIVTPPVSTTAQDLSQAGVLVNGRNVTASFDVKASGVLRVTLVRKGKTIASCENRTVAGQGASCKFVMPKAYDPGTVEVVGVLQTDAGQTVTTRTGLGAASFRRVVLKRDRMHVVAVVTPQRTAFVTVTFNAKGRVMSRCAQRVMPNTSLTCSRSVVASLRGTPFSVAVAMRDNQGRLAVTDGVLRPR